MKETIMTIRIATDFSRFPTGRYLSDGTYSGEGFMREKLIPALQNGGKVQIILDGTMGYGSSFLEEAFGGLVRLKQWSLEDLLTKIEIVSDEEPNLIHEIHSYMEDAADE